MSKTEFLEILAETLAGNAVPGYAGKRRGVKPDRVVERKVSNLLRGIDEQLDVALRLAQ